MAINYPTSRTAQGHSTATGIDYAKPSIAVVVPPRVGAIQGNIYLPFKKEGERYKFDTYSFPRKSIRHLREPSFYDTNVIAYLKRRFRRESVQKISGTLAAYRFVHNLPPSLDYLFLPVTLSKLTPDETEMVKDETKQEPSEHASQDLVTRVLSSEKENPRLVMMLNPDGTIPRWVFETQVNHNVDIHTLLLYTPAELDRIFRVLGGRGGSLSTPAHVGVEKVLQ